MVRVRLRARVWVRVKEMGWCVPYDHAFHGDNLRVAFHSDASDDSDALNVSNASGAFHLDRQAYSIFICVRCVQFGSSAVLRKSFSS